MDQSRSHVLINCSFTIISYFAVFCGVPIVNDLSEERFAFSFRNLKTYHH